MAACPERSRIGRLRCSPGNEPVCRSACSCLDNRGVRAGLRLVAYCTRVQAAWLGAFTHACSPTPRLSIDRQCGQLRPAALNALPHNSIDEVIANPRVTCYFACAGISSILFEKEKTWNE